MTPNELLAFQQGLISAAVIAAKTHDQPVRRTISPALRQKF